MKISYFKDKFSQNKQDGFIFEPNSHFKVTRNILEFGDINQHRHDAIAKVGVGKIKNLEIEVDFKMVDNDGKETSWFGIKIRSTDNVLNDGYLIYIRSNGNVSIYTAGDDLPRAQFQLTNSILNKKIKLKVTIIESKFIISVDGNKISYTDSDDRLLRKGNIYLYANYTKNYIYSIKIWNKIVASDIFKNQIFLGILFILILLLGAIGAYHFNPELVKSIINNPIFILWSNLK